MTNAELELIGAKARLERAILAFKVFVTEHGDGSHLSPELQESLGREMDLIASELDQASRAVDHAQANLEAAGRA
jgi:hypothetical protein